MNPSIHNVKHKKHSHGKLYVFLSLLLALLIMGVIWYNAPYHHTSRSIRQTLRESGDIFLAPALTINGHVTNDVTIHYDPLSKKVYEDLIYKVSSRDILPINGI